MAPVFFNNQDEFRTWLGNYHQAETELWVGYYKVETGKPSMTWSQSVDQAHCFGWIDGIRVAWLLIIPTTINLMNRFLAKQITEKELFNLTPPDTAYEALYLCSVLVLQEYRRKGITKRLALKAIEDIRKDHPLKCLFVWAFSKEGDQASEALAGLAGMPLFKREKVHDDLAR